MIFPTHLPARSDRRASSEAHRAPDAIPAVAHFIWYGSELAWVHALAIRSAAMRGGFERVVLHHDSDLSGTPVWPSLTALRSFEARPLDPHGIFRNAHADAGALGALHAELTSPSARANVVRAAILAAEGGVYLDLDTVTIRDLTPLRAAGVFCGEERVALPYAVATSRRIAPRAMSLVRMGFRDGVCRATGGWRWFRAIEHWYPRAANNAVLGARAQHPFIVGLLDAMLHVPRDRRGVRYALGTHLLQRQLERCPCDDLIVHSPEVFFPLGPGISEHWFRRARSVNLDDVLAPSTHVVHWYASVRTKSIVPRIEPEYVKQHARTQLFSALAAPFVRS